MRVRAKNPADQAWIEQALAERWGSPQIVVHGRIFDASELPALIAGQGEGLATFALDEDGHSAEIITLDAFRPRCGVGTALVKALVQILREHGVMTLRVTTTNDNLDALRFYQRRGFSLSAVRPGAVDEARKIKPSIPFIGDNGIPLRDEIELVRVIGRF